MKPSIYRRIRRRTASYDAVNTNKESKQEQSFFGDATHEPFFKPATAMHQSVQRKCADCEKEDKVQRAPEKKEEEKVMKKEEKKEEEKIQRAEDKKEEEKIMKKEDNMEEEKVMKMGDKKEEEKVQKKESDSSATNGKNVSNYISSLSGKGNPLPAQSNNFFSSKMGYDFSDVKIHNDKEAGESAKAINAKAYTIGNNVVFNEGQYNTESGEGKKLMAHELAHVVQQENDTSKKSIQRKTGDGHDLTNPRFAGDPVLENCYDNRQVLTVGSRGAAVSKVQQALVDAGYPLPIYHVDGIFGTETETAVLNFQRASTILVDGIVGPQTMGSLDALSGPAPAPAPAPSAKVCGPDVSAEIARIWGQIQSDFASWGFFQKEAACRYLVQPYIPGSGPNINAFDTLGLFQATTDWMRTSPYYPPCGVPGPVTSPANPFDPAYIDPKTCSSTVQAGSGCWLSGTVNYGTYGIMMKLCSDWTFLLKVLPPPFNEMGKYHDLFSPEMMMLAIYLYKEHYRSDDSGPPISWALATYFGGAAATASGGDRPNCQSTCSVPFGGPSFKYTWEPTHPRSSFP